VRAFLHEYGREPRELAVRQLKSWWFNLVLRVDADGEALVLRRYGVTPPEEVRWELAVIAHLRAHDFPVYAPVTRRNADEGQLGEFLGKPAILYPFIEGETGWNLDWSAALSQACSTVARLHSLTEGLEVPYPRVRSGTDSRRMVRQLLQLAARRGVAPHETNLHELLERAQGALDQFDARLAQYHADLPQSVVHHDAHLGNLLFHRGQLVALIDFDDAHYGYQVDDVAVMIENWACEGEPSGSMNIGKASAVVREYERHRELTSAEREMLPDFMLMYLLCDTAEDVRRAMARGEDVERAIEECDMYKIYLRHANDPDWRAALSSEV
jgi:homoserine kinase type II